MMNGNGKIWKNISKYMELRGETIATLAEKSSVTRQAIYLIKRRGTANTETLEKLAQALNTDISLLVTG
jgi:transcriptional regulator with XRE-family HTH domain